MTSGSKLANRRARILDAAQAQFLARGFAATTIAEIGTQSGSSIGSIYHAYPSKGAIAAALVERAIGQWRAATTACATGTDYAALLRATIEGLLIWAARDPEGFRAMDELGKIAVHSPEGVELERLIAAGREEARLAYSTAVEAGLARPLPWPAAAALMLGPAFEYLRQTPVAQRLPATTASAIFAAAALVAITPAEVG